MIFQSEKKLKTKKLSAVFPVKSGRRHHVLRFNFSAERAKLTCRCFWRLKNIFLFAAFRFDSERHPIRKVSAAPAPSNSAFATLHPDNECFIGEEFSDSMTARTIFVRKQYSLEYSGPKWSCGRHFFGLQLFEKANQRRWVEPWRLRIRFDGGTKQSCSCTWILFNAMGGRPFRRCPAHGGCANKLRTRLLH